MAAKNKGNREPTPLGSSSSDHQPLMAAKDKGVVLDRWDVAARVAICLRRVPGSPSLKLVEDYYFISKGWPGLKELLIREEKTVALPVAYGLKELLIREEKTVALPVAYASASSQSHEHILQKRAKSINTAQDIIHNLPESACRVPLQDESLVSDEESVQHPCAITSDSEVSQVKLSRLHELPVAPQSETEIPAKAVIAFVNEMERAHQHFKFIEYLFLKIKPDMDPRDVDDVAYEMGVQNYDDQEFNLLDMGDIRHAVKCYALELIRCREMENLTDKVLNNDPYAYKNPIFYIVFQTIKKDSLVCPKPHVEREGRTVIVKNISLDVSGKDVWQFFLTCGSIEHIETHRVSESQKAYITFRKQSGAKYAQSYTDVGVPHKLRIKGVPLLVEPVAVQNAKGSKSDVEKAEDISTMLAKACSKYNELKMYYSQIQKRSTAPKKVEWLGSAYEGGGGWDPSLVKEECWDYCEWMQLEALMNGGFTVGGQSLLHPPDVA